MNFQNIAISSTLACVLGAAMGPFVIPFLLRLKVGQTVRDEGPEAHKKKTGTPTMGGIMIIISLLIASMPFAVKSSAAAAVLVLTVGYGFIGFLDDYIKVVLKRSMGLKPMQKLLGQFVITAVFYAFIAYMTDISLAMRIPFTTMVLDFGMFNIPILFFIAVGTSNGTNFTDGLDGLASSVTVVVAFFFTAAAMLIKPECAPVAAAMMGALLGFLAYNAYPAKVFMGDTGSLALGGFAAGMAYVTGLQLFLVMVGFIYVIEVVSVIMQVSYFKATHGKRIFKMAPIHHHFELCGWSETRVVTVFTTVTIIMCMIAFCAIRL